MIPVFYIYYFIDFGFLLNQSSFKLRKGKMPPKKTKEWNVETEAMSDDESLYVDYRDPNKTEVTSYKLRTKQGRSRLWIYAHKLHPEFQTAKWEMRATDVITLRTGSHNRSLGSIVVKFHLVNDVILIQGKAMNVWKNYYQDFKSKVDELYIGEPPSDLDDFISQLQSTTTPRADRNVSQCDSLEIVYTM